MINVKNQYGMTLIEIIAALLILSFLCVISVTYLSSGLTEVSSSVMNIKDLASLNSVLDRVTIDYKNIIKADPTPLETLKTRIGNQGTNANNSYGSYFVAQNSYIEFGAGNVEQNDSSPFNTLKVKLQIGNRTLTALYTE